MAPQEIVVTAHIAAPPAAVWAAVSDPESYGRWSPESTGARRRSGVGPWAVGDRFTGRNRVWVPWTTSCRIAAAHTERRFAFDVDLGPFPIARWSYELEPLTDGGTRVTERWTDRRHGILGRIARPAGLAVGRGYDAATRNRLTMQATLDALKSDLESKV